MSRSRSRFLALAVLLVILSGCRPAQPGESAWRATAQRSVSDVASEVATARLTALQVLDERLVGRYAHTVLTYAEEAAGVATERGVHAAAAED